MQAVNEGNIKNHVEEQKKRFPNLHGDALFRTLSVNAFALPALPKGEPLAGRAAPC